MNSTSPISNLKEIYSNSNKIEIYSNVFLPLKHTLQGKSYEKSLSLNREFDESK